MFTQVQDGDILLYVHGFRNQFSDAILRAAQLRYDLDFPGKVVAFSWPSDGALSKEAYMKAQGLANVSVGDLAEVIRLLASKKDGDPDCRIHIIAHSLGNRVLLGAIGRLSAQGVLGEKNKALGNVILAAPDVELLAFHQQIPYAMSASQRTTFYFCKYDIALLKSKEYNYCDPAGLVPYLLTGLDSIDVGSATTLIFSHSYYSSSRQILTDMRLLITKNVTPDKRMPPLTSKLELHGRYYWSFDKVQVAAAVTE